MPESAIAFKEWLLVCEAMGRGESSLLLRKGGIAEGRDGFSFKHPRFFLFPTFFHEQAGSLRLKNPPSLPSADEARTSVTIAQAAEVLWTATVTEESLLPKLAPSHLWTEDVVRDRFAYEGTPGVHVAFCRVSVLETPVVLPWERGFGGCRSWVNLPADFTPGPLRPARPEAELQEESRALRVLLG